MNRCKFILVFILLSKFCVAQDFIVLKKKSKVIQTWFSGQHIYVQINNGSWINALINKIQLDSLYLRPFSTPIVFNRFGMPITDTVFYGTMRVAVSNLHAFPRNESMPYVKNGSLLQLGGGGYLLLNLINTLSNNQPVFGSKNIPKISIAAAVFAIGTIIHRTHKSNYIIGKKYHVEYISSKPSS
jgi:hypothetical protein